MKNPFIVGFLMSLISASSAFAGVDVDQFRSELNRFLGKVESYRCEITTKDTKKGEPTTLILEKEEGCNDLNNCRIVYSGVMDEEVESLIGKSQLVFLGGNSNYEATKPYMNINDDLIVGFYVDSNSGRIKKHSHFRHEIYHMDAGEVLSKGLGPIAEEDNRRIRCRVNSFKED